MKQSPRKNLPALAFALLLLWLSFGSARANNSGGGTGTGANVTITDNGSTVTMANGIVSILITKSNGTVTSINYTYNNGAGNVTTQVLSGGTNGGQLYWLENSGSFLAGPFTATVVANTGDYAEINLSYASPANGMMELHYSMLRGSTGFYVTPILTHRAQDAQIYITLRPNIYAGAIFNWMSVDADRNKLMEVPGGTTTTCATSPVENYLWTSGIYQGLYEDKYKYTANLYSLPAWGWSSVTTTTPAFTGKNIGLWNILGSGESYPGGPLERSLMEHIGTTILNVFTGGYFGTGTDGTLLAGEIWTKTYGPYFYYFNNIPTSVTNPVQASQALFADAIAQGAAERAAWPYGWFVNPTNYAPASGRGTVTGKMVIADSGNPNASAANLWVGVVQQPTNNTGVYDFQRWTKPYQFWVKTSAGGNFSIPNVIAGTNYTLHAFGPGAAGTFMSQAQTGGSPPLILNIPPGGDSRFPIVVTGGGTTVLGDVTWTPSRSFPTVFEIGYPDRTASKFRHGDDYWVGDIGPSPTAPSPVWTKFLEFPFDFPNGVNYAVGTSRWSTDWNFIQPSVYSSTGTWNSSGSTISFHLPPGTNLTGNASIYLGLASDYYAAVIITVNGKNISSLSGLSATPNASVPSSGYYVGYGDSDSSVREGNNGAFSDERLTFPASNLKADTATDTAGNTINISIRQIGGSYFADHAMYDYIRLELANYVPPAPASVTAYPGYNCALVTWPVTPGATSYKVLRSTTNGSGYASIATGVIGPVSGSGPANATYLDTTAANDVTYYYVVQSTNPVSSSPSSVQSTGVTPLVTASLSQPAAPTNLVATPANGSVALGWAAPSGANYYTVKRSTLVANGGGTYNTLSTITLNNNVTGTSYTDNTPTNGSTYSYLVEATNSVGTSVDSNPVTTRPVAAAPTAAPPNLTATPGLQQVTLNWSAVANAVGYTVQIATAPGGPYTYVATVSSLTYTDAGQADNTTYYYVVSAVNSGGSSANSNEVKATTAPVAATGITVTPGNTQATLNWTASAGATAYQVQRATVAGGPYTVVGTVPSPSFTDNNLVNGTTYYYVVAAQDGVATSAISPEVSVTPVATVPVAPTGFATSVANSQIVLTWTASAGATSYIVRRAVTPGGAYTTLASGITTTTYTDTTVIAPNVYYYVVVAVNAGGMGANSTRASGTLVPPHLVWNGTASSSTWDFAATDWLNAGTPAAYADGAYVTFDDTAATTTVTIGSAVTPAILSFANATANYTVNGSAITGGIGLTKTGAGSVTFNNLNSYTGTTAITGGTVALGATGNTGGSLGASPIQLNQGGTLRMASAGRNSSASAMQVAPGASVTLSSANLSNSYGGALSGPANATLTISGPISFSVSGTAQFSGFNGLVIISPGSQLRFNSTGGANGNGGAAATFQVDGILNSRNAAGAGGIVLGALTGSGKVQGQTNTAVGNDLYFVGSNNLDSTFSGGIVDGTNGTASLTKVGSGTLTLSGANTYTGPTVVSAGTLKITGSETGSKGLTIASGAALNLAGGSLSVSGNIVNNGTVKLSGAATLSSSGSFTNNGILDLINGPSTLPANFINNGTVLDSSTVRVQQSTISGSDFSLTIQSYSGHTYQLQRCDALIAGTWTNVGSPQPGTDSMLNFTDPGAVTNSSGFYRVVVSP